MSRSGLDEARAAWAQTYEGLTEQAIDARVTGFTALVRGIARSGAVTAAGFSRETTLSENEASEVFEGLAAMGLERDDEGRIVGAALTTTPTPHAVAVAGRSLFAWCALDTLFIPGLLGEAAEIRSTCPVSQTTIRLTVTPMGVSAVSPPEVALTVVLPSVGSSGAATGLASPT